MAVRSSGTAEDLASASFAGQHDTFLDVSGAEALLASRASLLGLALDAARRRLSPGARLGRGERADSDLALAVVVQRMVPADAAGVAFTANPLTGDRDETSISAVRGLGERLVSGQGAADEWVVRGDEATCRRNAEGALHCGAGAGGGAAGAPDRRRVRAPHRTLSGRSVAATSSSLQARPMTALPEPMSWRRPPRAGWMRNFRLGEWLPEPVTPLFESWLLRRMEEAEVAGEARDFGLRIRPPYHVVVNGWYYSSVQGGGFAPRNVTRRSCVTHCASRRSR